MDQSELVQKYGMGKCATRHSSLSYDTQRRVVCVWVQIGYSFSTIWNGKYLSLTVVFA